MIEKFPADTVATLEDFRASKWREAISSADGELSVMSAPLSAAARIALDEGKPTVGKILWLLSDACSMMLTPESNNNPFRPFAEMDGKRSAIPEDFAPEDVDLLAEIAIEVDEPSVQARLADLAWLMRKPKNTQDALLAIDAYTKTPLNEDHWYGSGRNGWARSIILAKSLKDKPAISRIEAALLTAFASAVEQDGFFGLQLARLLSEQRLARPQSLEIARALGVAGQRAERADDFRRARDYTSSASEWFVRAQDNTQSVEMTIRVAECWVKEAEARASGSQPSHTVAASFYENAIQTYRTIPRTQREAYNVDGRLAELYKLIAEAGQKSLGELSTISTPPLDISELVNGAQDAVRGKAAPDALLAFGKLYSGARVKKLRETSTKLMQEHPLSALFAVTHISKDGRVIAKHPGAGFGRSETDEAEPAVWAKMVQNYVQEISLVVQAQILPAYWVLTMEHRLTERDFFPMLQESPIVPKGRERLFAKGLFAGFDGDFVSAIHLLVPQVENMVRVHLKAAGVKTSNIDKEGIENENGLSTLVDLPEVQNIFGENLAFELKALFCDAFGPNMRNQLAHGLLDYGECGSLQSIYVWWLVLKLTFMTFWNSMHEAQSGNANPADI